MSLELLTGLFGILASVVAAVYAGLTYHRPKGRIIAGFRGRIPEDARGLVSFLARHEGELVNIHLDMPPAGSFPTLEHPYPLEQTFDGDKITERLVLDMNFPEGDVISKVIYTVKTANRGSCLRKSPAADRFIKGTFVSRNDLGFAGGVSFGELIEVEPVRRAVRN